MRFTFKRLEVRDDDGHLFHFIPIRQKSSFVDKDAAFREILAWTAREFGEGRSVTGLRQAIGSRWCYKASAWTVWMRDEADAFQFRLRWC